MPRTPLFITNHMVDTYENTFRLVHERFLLEGKKKKKNEQKKKRRRKKKEGRKKKTKQYNQISAAWLSSEKETGKRLSVRTFVVDSGEKHK